MSSSTEPMSFNNKEKKGFYMKKTLIYLLTVLTLFGVTVLPAFAEAGAPAEGSLEEVTETVTEAPVLTEPTDTEEQSALWQEMVDYLQQNGIQVDSFGEETVDKLILLGEQFADLKEQGYTLEERLGQLITPENLLTTASALVLVLSTVALFLIKSRQRAAALRTAASMNALKDAYDREAEENQTLRGEVTALREEQTAMHDLLRQLCEESALGAKALKQTEACSLGVANMVKDVFLNSKSLDHAGKDLMIRNYLAATSEVKAQKEGGEAEA